MIKTQLTREDAFKILEMGREFHKESRFKDEAFDVEKIWSVLDRTVIMPEKYFIAYDSEFKGFILMHMGTEFFNSVIRASDLCLYIAPEHRGGALVIKLIQEARKWAKDNGAYDMTIYHNTGIAPDKAIRLFERLGFTLNGYIFGHKLNV
jgi:ribosomal protein S18 acetylase RimI-like enzyme